jgi:hypothetical protein
MADPQVLVGPPRRPRRGRRALVLLALALSVAGLGVSATGIAIQVLPRQFSLRQQHQIEAWEVASRWQQLTAAQIFPATVTYSLSPNVLGGTGPLSVAAVRVGIAPQSGCAGGATTSAAAAVLRRSGCRAVLRATYVDATRSYVMTIGVAVLPTASAAKVASLGLARARLASRGSARAVQLSPGVLVVRFRGLAGQYDYSRQVAADFSAGPYLVMYAAGYADSRPQVQVSQDPYADGEMTSLAVGVARSVAHRLTAPPPVPHCPGAPEC